MFEVALAVFRETVRFLLVFLVALGGCIATLPHDDAGITAELAADYPLLTSSPRSPHRM